MPDRPVPASIDVSPDRGSGEGAVVRIAGALTLDSTPALWSRIGDTAAPAERAAEIDVTAVPVCDFAGATFLVALQRRLARGGPAPAFRGANPQVGALLRLVEGAELVPDATGAPRDDDEALFEKVGQRTWRELMRIRDTLDYIGRVVSALALAVLRPSTVRWGDVTATMSRAGADALPIVALINFLMGVILAFQGVNLLGQLGFDSYTPDAVAVSILLELGPLMTAVIVAGRSGSAFAAEIGTMKVNEEVDALETMGLDRTRFLVVPKVLALCAMMPILVVFAGACGLIGGCAVGVSALDMTIAQYFQRSFEHVRIWGATQGLIKGEAYAICIAAVGCLRGLRTEQGAQGVGLAATSAVVSSIFLIIVTDAVLTVFFHLLPGPAW